MESLSKDLLLELFDYLDADSLLAISEVKSSWKKLIINSSSTMRKFPSVLSATKRKLPSGDYRDEFIPVIKSPIIGQLHTLIIDQMILSTNYDSGDFEYHKRSLRQVEIINSRITHSSFQRLFSDCPLLSDLLVFSSSFPGPAKILTKLPNLKAIKVTSDNFTIFKTIQPSASIQTIQILGVAGRHPYQPRKEPQSYVNFLMNCSGLKTLSTMIFSKSFLNEQSDFPFKLNQLSLEYISENNPHSEQIAEFLRKQKSSLKELEINASDEVVLKCILFEMQLETLRLGINRLPQEINFFDWNPPNKFLKKLAMYGKIPDLNRIKRLISNYPAIETLLFYEQYRVTEPIIGDFISHLSFKLPNLKHLRLPSIRGTIAPTAHFNNLKTLHVAKINNMEEGANWMLLTAYSPNIQKLAIGRVENLFLSNGRLEVVLSRLPNLQELCLGSVFDIDEQAYNIINTSARNLRKLTVFTDDEKSKTIIHRIMNRGLKCFLYPVESYEYYDQEVSEVINGTYKAINEGRIGDTHLCSGMVLEDHEISFCTLSFLHSLQSKLVVRTFKMEFLSDDLLLEIFSYLDKASLKALMKVKPSWSHLITNSGTTMQKFPAVLVPKGENEEKGLAKFNLSVRGQLHTLDVFMTRIRLPFTNKEFEEQLKTLRRIFIVRSSWTQEAFCSLFRNCELLTDLKLTINHICYPYRDGKEADINVSVPNLKNLEIEGLVDWSVFKLLKPSAKMQSIKISNDSVMTSAEENFFERFLMECPGLKTFAPTVFVNTFLNEKGFVYPFRLEKFCFEYPSHPKMNVNELVDFLRQQKSTLKELELRNPQDDLVFNCIVNELKLETFRVGSSYLPRVLHCLDRNSKNLYLKNLIFYGNVSRIESVKQLISHYPAIETLKFYMNYDFGLHRKHRRRERFGNVCEILIHISENLKNLKHLRIPSLETCIYGMPIKIDSLESLHINRIKNDYGTHHLMILSASCKNIKKLTIEKASHYTIPEELLYMILTNLKDLRELCLGLGYRMDQDIFDIIKAKSKNLKKLTIFAEDMTADIVKANNLEIPGLNSYIYKSHRLSAADLLDDVDNLIYNDTFDFFSYVSNRESNEVFSRENRRDPIDALPMERLCLSQIVNRIFHRQ
ncbi:CLUMA_CG020530, isoform A [Clunio marinus]|uniref:CLUMA_CG020530, isoform A n=1 Tax=Clunio marinus TaxID=568069 RepID=A0A1J1J580_9DIPT|nr:CLUMA_CG020530, isoform A [Clunio marinus]